MEKCKTLPEMRKIPNLKVCENKFLKVYKHMLTYLNASKNFLHLDNLIRGQSAADW